MSAEKAFRLGAIKTDALVTVLTPEIVLLFPGK
jgi:hypothetical protein